MPNSKRIEMKINGESYAAEVEPRLLLVDFLRVNARLTGTHVGCDTSNCGACTVMMDDLTVKSCTVFAVQADGREIFTVEGLSKDGKLHPIQESFRDHHALQCGYCTPGMMLSSLFLLSNKPDPTEEEVRKGICGNICLCTGYQHIVNAVLAMAKRGQRQQKKRPGSGKS